MHLSSLDFSWLELWGIYWGQTWWRHHDKSSNYCWNVTQFSVMRIWIHMNRLAHQEKQLVNNLLFSLGALPACNNPSHQVCCGPHRVLQMLHFFLLQWLLRPDNLPQWAVSYPRAASYCYNRTAPVVLMRRMGRRSSAVYKAVFPTGATWGNTWKWLKLCSISTLCEPGCSGIWSN